MDQVNKDNRFAHITKDARFHQMPRHVRKVKIDKRFKTMFSDKRFKLKYQVDKRGKPVHTSSNENLKKYYELDSSDDEDKGSSESDESESASDSEMKSDKLKEKKGKKNAKETMKKSMKEVSLNKRNTKIQNSELDEDNDDDDDDDDDEDDDNRSGEEKLSVAEIQSDSNIDEEAGKYSSDDEQVKKEYQVASEAIQQGIDLARGQGNVSSSSDSDEDSDSEDSGVDDDGDGIIEHRWGEFEADAPEAQEITRRLALCNMDWDRIKSQDILVLMNSFKKQGGFIEHVKIYPSEYGLKRMDEDNRLGPAELRSVKKHPDNSSDEEDSQSQSYREKLRQYQINRLKYYYAVITCDSSETADAIYEECDGLEYETSSAKIDLRFIPDDMEFNQEPTSVADKVLDGVNYKPSTFITTALNQTRVNLTWEETDPDRLKQTMRKFTKDEVDEMDLKAYLASDSDEDEDEVAKKSDEISKFRSLLGDTKTTKKDSGDEESIDEKVEDGDMEMEITWEPGLKVATEKAAKQKARGGQTPWEKYLEKRAQKQREKLDEKMKKKNMKKKGWAEESESGDDDDDTPAGVDMEDPFFRDAFSDDDNYEKKTKKSDCDKKQKKMVKKNKQKESEANPDLDLLVMDEDDHKQHFSLEQIMKNEKKNNKKKKNRKNDDEEAPMREDTFEFDLKDERFAAVYTTSAYNIDPSAPDFKKTKTMEAIVKEKGKRRAKEGGKSAATRRLRTEEPRHQDSVESIQSLVKSVKAKAKMSQDGKKRKKLN